MILIQIVLSCLGFKMLDSFICHQPGCVFTSDTRKVTGFLNLTFVFVSQERDVTELNLFPSSDDRLWRHRDGQTERTIFKH